MVDIIFTKQSVKHLVTTRFFIIAVSDILEFDSLFQCSYDDLYNEYVLAVKYCCMFYLFGDLR